MEAAGQRRDGVVRRRAAGAVGVVRRRVAGEGGGVRRTLAWLRWAVFALVLWFLVVPLVPGFGEAVEELRRVDRSMLLIGVGLEFVALWFYSLLTHAALGPEAGRLSLVTLFRIQLSTRALGSIVPGGSAASTALGFRLVTLGGIPGRDAGFALAAAGVGSAVVLNVLLWVGLVVSIPIRGVNALYGTAALAVVVIMLVAGVVVLGLVDHERRAERVLRRLARTVRRDPDRASEVAVHLGDRLRGLAAEPGLLRRVVVLASVNWILDMAALWVFIRAFDGEVSLDGLVIAFGLANVFASIPVTPGGLGIVEGVYIPTLVGFGLATSTATVAVLSYRIVQHWLPMLVGAVAYLSLRVGPFALEAGRELKSLQRYATAANAQRTSRVEWVERNATTDRTREMSLPKYDPRYGLGDTDDIGRPDPAPRDGH